MTVPLKNNAKSWRFKMDNTFNHTGYLSIEK